MRQFFNRKGKSEVYTVRTDRDSGRELQSNTESDETPESNIVGKIDAIYQLIRETMIQQKKT